MIIIIKTEYGSGALIIPVLPYIFYLYWEILAVNSPQYMVGQSHQYMLKTLYFTQT